MILTVVGQEICDLFLFRLFYSNIFLTSLAKSQIYFKSGFICCWQSRLQMLFTEEKRFTSVVFCGLFLHFADLLKCIVTKNEVGQKDDNGWVLVWDCGDG
jgi:hypothetical protein